MLLLLFALVIELVAVLVKQAVMVAENIAVVIDHVV